MIVTRNPDNPANHVNPVKRTFHARLVVLLTPLLALALSCSPSSRTASGVGNGPVAQSTATPQSQSTPTDVKSPLPPPTGFVADYANVIDSGSEARLQSTLTELREKSGIEFAVVTVETTGEQSIFDYSLAVARGWGVGPKDSSKGGGLLLMLAIKDRQWRIQVSRGLEKDLPEEVTKPIGAELENLCKQQKYAEGITTFVTAIIKKLQETKGFQLN
jgi:uncharacterized membrane protein YgcG